MLHPQFNREGNNMFYPLCVIFLVRRANWFEWLVPSFLTIKAMTPSDIPNLPLSLLGLQGADVQLKDTVRNHDSHVDCLAALPQILVKPYEPFAMSRFHYGAL
eukprot:664670-Ditylum_brightwellii.AAC.1